MKRLNFILLLLLAALLLLSKGRTLSITDKSIVHALAVDSSPEGFAVTLQIFKPEAAGADTPVDISKANFKTITAEGSTVSYCLTKLSRKTGTELFLGHLQLVVLGENISFSDIEEVTSPLREDKSIYPGLYLACAKNAKEIISFPIKENAVTAENYRGILENSASRGSAFLARLIDIDNSLSECGCLAVPYLEISGEEDEKCLNVTGSKVLGKTGFYDHTISPEECSLLSLLTSPQLDTQPPHELLTGDEVIPLKSVNKNIFFAFSEGRLHCKINIRAKAQNSADINSETADTCEKLLKAYLEKYLIQQGCDIVTLFKPLRLKEPRLFVRYKNDLYSLYSTAEFEVSFTLSS